MNWSWFPFPNQNIHQNCLSCFLMCTHLFHSWSQCNQQHKYRCSYLCHLHKFLHSDKGWDHNHWYLWRKSERKSSWDLCLIHSPVKKCYLLKLRFSLQIQRNIYFCHMFLMWTHLFHSWSLCNQQHKYSCSCLCHLHKFLHSDKGWDHIHWYLSKNQKEIKIMRSLFNWCSGKQMLPPQVLRFSLKIQRNI